MTNYSASLHDRIVPDVHNFDHGMPVDTMSRWEPDPSPKTRSNEPLEKPLTADATVRMIQQAEAKIAELFDILLIDHSNDHNTRDTPARFAKMLVEDTLRGRFRSEPSITEFDNALNYDDLIVTGPIDIRSTCAHHMMPIVGHAYIGVIPCPDGKIIGLSKYDRIAQHFAARLQIQEELVEQISQYIIAKTSPRGLAVRISAVHMCKTHRGVFASPHSKMVTTVFSGHFRDDRDLRQQFLRECNSIANENLKCV